MSTKDCTALATIASAAGAASGLGSFTLATITTTVPAWGVLGWIGLTTTATSVIAIPVAGIVLIGGALYYGGRKVHDAMSW